MQAVLTPSRHADEESHVASSQLATLHAILPVKDQPLRKHGLLHLLHTQSTSYPSNSALNLHTNEPR